MIKLEELTEEASEATRNGDWRLSAVLWEQVAKELRNGRAGSSEAEVVRHPDAGHDGAGPDIMHRDPLVEILALLDRLEASGESYGLDLIRMHVPERVRQALAGDVAKLNAAPRKAGY